MKTDEYDVMQEMIRDPEMYSLDQWDDPCWNVHCVVDAIRELEIPRPKGYELLDIVTSLSKYAISVRAGTSIEVDTEMLTDILDDTSVVDPGCQDLLFASYETIPEVRRPAYKTWARDAHASLFMKVYDLALAELKNFRIYHPKDTPHSGPDAAGIYFINAVGTNFYKIGITTDSARNRIRGLSTGCPYNLAVTHVIPIASKNRMTMNETCLHNTLGKYRMRPNGEWFALPEHIIQAVKAGELTTVDALPC